MKTDIQLQHDVIAELNWESSVTVPAIAVDVMDGVLTFSGEVSRYPEKLSAENATRRVCGGKALATDLEVKLAGSSKRSDADIVKSAEDALDWTTWVPESTVKVRVEGGWVTLFDLLR